MVDESFNEKKELLPEKRGSLSPADAEKRRRRITLLLSFLVPFFGMMIIYTCLAVYPAGKESVLVLDLNAQYIYYFEQLRAVLTEGKSLIYTFERALGGEFMGMFAYYLSSPFSLIVALFPKESITEAMYLILLLKTGCAGLTFGYLLIRTRELRPCSTVMFSTMYALCSYAVVMQHNVMWMDNVLVFPLILLAVDELICRRKYKLYVITLVYSIMSNFYIGYMVCLFILVWFFVRYFMLTPEERGGKTESNHFYKSFFRIGGFSLLAVMISAVIILPVYYSLSFGKLEFTTPNFTPKQIFDFADLLTKGFFGSYDTVRPTGMPFYYCGTLALILSPLYFFSEKIPMRKKVGMAVIMLFLIASFNFSILDIIWHGMQKPNWLNARFSYMFTALMLLMAVDAFINIKEIGVRAFYASAVLWCGLLLILAKIGYDNLPDFTCVWASILIFVLLCGVMPSYIRSIGENSKKSRRIMRYSSSALAVIVICEAVCNGVVMVYALDDDVSYSNRNSYRQMIDTYSEAVASFAENDGDEFYRAEKLVHRKKNDNFALGIRGMSNSTSTLNSRQIALLAQFGYAAMSHWSMYAGATAVTDALFDIKYVMVDESDDKPVMSYIHSLYEFYDSTDEGIDVYENPYALSIAYAVNEEVLDYDKPRDDEDYYVDPFTYMNKLLSAMVGHEVQVWSQVDIASSSEYGVDLIFTTGHRGYEDNKTGTPRIEYTLNIEKDEPVYVYFPSKYPREATMKLNGQSIGTFFENEDFSIRELGTFEEGEEVDFSLYLEESNLYIRTGCQYFWYFNEDEFKSAISELKDGVMDAHSDSDAHIYGSITVPDGDGVVFTTIPYDEGWKITVDGNEVELVPVLNDSLIAFKAEPGQHEIEMKYEPDCVKYGVILSIIGAAVFILLCAGEYLLKKYRKKPAKLTEEIPLPQPETESETEEEIQPEQNKDGQKMTKTALEAEKSEDTPSQPEGEEHD